MADDKNLNAINNSINDIKLAEQKNAASTNKLLTQIAANKPVANNSQIDNSKFITDLEKSELFKKMASSLSILAKSAADNEEANKNLLDIKNSITELSKLFASEKNTNLSTLPELFEKNSFFKNISDKIDSIENAFKVQTVTAENKSTETTVETTSEDKNSAALTEITNILNTINTSLESFLEKNDELVTAVENLSLDELKEKLLTAETLTDILQNNSISIDSETLTQDISEILSNNQTELTSTLTDLITNINLTLPPKDAEDNSTEILTDISESIDALSEKIENKNIAIEVFNRIKQESKNIEEEENNNQYSINIVNKLNNNIKQSIADESITENNIEDLSENESTFNISNDEFLDFREELNSDLENIQILLSGTEEETEVEEESAEEIEGEEESEESTNANMQDFEDRNRENEQAAEINSDETEELTKVEVSANADDTMMNALMEDRLAAAQEAEQFEEPSLAEKPKETPEVPEEEKSSLKEAVGSFFSGITKELKSLLPSNLFGSDDKKETESKEQVTSEPIKKVQEEAIQVSEPTIQKKETKTPAKGESTIKKQEIESQVTEESDIKKQGKESAVSTESIIQKQDTESQIASPKDLKKIQESTITPKIDVEQSSDMSNSQQLSSMSTTLYKTASKKLEEKSMKIDTNIKESDKQITNILDKESENEDTEYSCSILNGDDADAFNLLANGETIKEIQAAIEMLNEAVEKLKEDATKPEYSEYKKRIDVYLQTLANLNSLLQKKLKNLIEKEQVDAAIDNLNKIPKKDDNSISGEFSSMIFEMLTNLGDAKKEILQESGISEQSFDKLKTSVPAEQKEIKQPEIPIDETENEKFNLVNEIDSLLEKMSPADLNDDVKLACKGYTYNLLTANEEKTREIDKNFNFKKEDVDKYGSSAINEFFSTYKANKNFLAYDKELNSKVMYPEHLKEALLSHVQAQFDSITYQKKENNIEAPEMPTISTASSPKQKTSKSSEMQEVQPPENNEFKPVPVKMADNQQQNLLSGGDDADPYSMMIATGSKELDTYIKNAKKAYIDMISHDQLVENPDLSKEDLAKLEKASGKAFDEAYEKGKVLSVNEESEIGQESLKDLKSKYGVKDDLANQMTQDIMKLLKNLNQAKKDANEMFNDPNKGILSQVSSSDDSSSLTSKFANSSIGMNIKEKINSGKDMIVERGKAAVQSATNAATDMISTVSPDKLIDNAKDFAVNAASTFINTSMNKTNELLEKLVKTAEKGTNAIYIPVADRGTQVKLK